MSKWKKSFLCMNKKLLKQKTTKTLLLRKLKQLKLKSQFKFLGLKSTFRSKKLQKNQFTSEKPDKRFVKFKLLTKKFSKETDTSKQKGKYPTSLLTDKLFIQTEKYQDLSLTLNKEKSMLLKSFKKLFHIELFNKKLSKFLWFKKKKS